ncbi:MULTISPECIES: AbrB family transcriptional regulator [Roseobacteraceae]|uniref:Putative ammonia monooxygenase n=1 Tax=Pseudosulfitobacter pseudonitzschiae TaxID=1402135 RepID=A0A221K7J1_9RHOB|nr:MULTISPECIES: AbrB family transcriptional regulator [Roseobacteraceae]ASM74982.1 putative ammonia monooxygenase [Pseudosulfitobacter pseudonitzschiae]
MSAVIRSIAPPLVALILGGAGAAMAVLVHLPLAMVTGPLIVLALFTMRGGRVFGQAPTLPSWLSLVVLPVIGLAIGSSLTPEVLISAKRWWPSLLSMLLFIPLVHYLGFVLFRHVGRLDPATSYFAAVPGGLMEVLLLAEETDAHAGTVLTLQFLRIVLCVLLVPLGFSLMGADLLPVSTSAMSQRFPTLIEVTMMIACAAAGVGVGKLLRFPAAVVTGPMLCFGALQLWGITDAAPPPLSLAVTQLIMGSLLGLRFTGLPMRQFVVAIQLALANLAITMTLAVGFAFLFHGLVAEPVEALVLAYAPGGLAEMSLVAASLHIGLLYVSVHHLLRIILAILFARHFASSVRCSVPASGGSDL